MAHTTLPFGDQLAVPVIGLGTWYMGEQPDSRKQEIAALQAGIDLGLTLIDTAEMYADGGRKRWSERRYADGAIE